MLATGTTAKIFPGQQDAGPLVAWEIEGEIGVQRPLAAIGVGFALIEVSQLIKQIGAEARAFDGLEKLLGDDQIGIDIGPVHGRHETVQLGEGFHAATSPASRISTK